MTGERADAADRGTAEAGGALALLEAVGSEEGEARFLRSLHGMARGHRERGTATAGERPDD